MVANVLRIGEIVVLLFVILVIFSASRMGALGNALGKFVYSFKKAMKGQGFVDVNRPPLRSSSKTPGQSAQDADIVDHGRAQKKPPA